jgi:hypothetical protein
MTMIFYSNIADDLVQDSYLLLTTMVVYRGKQPTVAEYITKVNNGTYAWTGNYLLQAYKDVDFTFKTPQNVQLINDDVMYPEHFNKLWTLYELVFVKGNRFDGTSH